MTKEDVKQEYRYSHESKHKWKEGRVVQPSLTDDLESFYNSLQNPESEPKEEALLHCFVAKKLDEEELRLLNDRNEEYLNTFRCYNQEWQEKMANTPGWEDKNRLLSEAAERFNDDMEDFEKSSDPESKFCYSCCGRWTFTLHVTLKSMQWEMRKRASNENLSDMTLKKQRVNWYNRSQDTYKFVKKE